MSALPGRHTHGAGGGGKVMFGCRGGLTGSGRLTGIDGSGGKGDGLFTLSPVLLLSIGREQTCRRSSPRRGLTTVPLTGVVSHAGRQVRHARPAALPSVRCRSRIRHLFSASRPPAVTDASPPCTAARLLPVGISPHRKLRRQPCRSPLSAFSLAPPPPSSSPHSLHARTDISPSLAFAFCSREDSTPPSLRPASAHAPPPLERLLLPPVVFSANLQGIQVMMGELTTSRPFFNSTGEFFSLSFLPDTMNMVAMQTIQCPDFFNIATCLCDCGFLQGIRRPMT